MKMNFLLRCVAVVISSFAFLNPANLLAQDTSEIEKQVEKQEAETNSGISIEGTFTVKSGERAGTEVDEARFPESIAITDETITIATPGGDFVMSYEIVSDESPYHVDMQIEEGPGEGNALGIVKMENGTVALCYDPMGENRPEAFETTEENGFFMFVMEKAITKLDPAKMVGEWQCVKGMKGGEEIPEERMASAVTFSEDMITIPIGPDMAFKMSYTVNAENTPATIDMKIEEGPGDGGNALGIVKIEDGKFYLCYDPTGENRPESFESNDENGFFSFEMEQASD